MTDAYWATKPSHEMARIIPERVKAWDDFLEATGRTALYSRAARVYYGLDAHGRWINSSAVSFGGEQGEVVLLHVNQFRSIVDQRVIHATGNRPYFQGLASNPSSVAEKAVEIAERLVEHDLAFEHAEEAWHEAVLASRYFGEGWIESTWDFDAGENFGVSPDGTTIKTGAPTCRVYNVLDVARDPSTEKSRDCQWLITRRAVSKWDLAATYPEFADKLTSAMPAEKYGSRFSWDRFEFAGSAKDNDWTFMLTLYHRSTKAVPGGRMVTVVGDTVLFDGPLPYDDLPLDAMSEGEEPDAPVGHSTDWDLLGPQEALNSAVSTILTNHDAFGVQNILVPDGANVDVEDLRGGLRFIKANMAAGEIKPLQLLRVDPTSFEIIKFCIEVMETLSGINSVARGNPQASLKSGSSLAMVQSMAIQANSHIKNTADRFLERVLNKRIRLYQRFAATERVLTMVGVDEKTAVLKFKAEDIAPVKRVILMQDNPAMRMLSMRRELASEMAERFPQQVTPSQFFEVIKTGRFEPITDAPAAQTMHIRWENERLIAGLPCRVIGVDDHPSHIQEHVVTLYDAVHREDEIAIAGILAHIQEHVGMIPQPAPPPEAGDGKKKGNGAGGQQTGDRPTAKADVIGAPTAENEGIAGSMPAMPKNPMTGEQAQPGGS